MRNLVLLFVLSSGYCFAGEVSTLSPEEARSLGFSFASESGSTPEEKAELEEHAICTPVEFSLPLYISEKYPEWTQVLISGEIYLLGKVLATTGTYSLEFEGKNMAYLCVPFGAEYKVNLNISYVPAEIKKFPMCPLAYELLDFKRFVDFKNGE